MDFQSLLGNCCGNGCDRPGASGLFGNNNIIWIILIALFLCGDGNFFGDGCGCKKKRKKDCCIDPCWIWVGLIFLFFILCPQNQPICCERENNCC